MNILANVGGATAASTTVSTNLTTWNIVTLVSLLVMLAGCVTIVTSSFVKHNTRRGAWLPKWELPILLVALLAGVVVIFGSSAAHVMVEDALEAGVQELHASTWDKVVTTEDKHALVFNGDVVVAVYAGEVRGGDVVVTKISE